MLRTSQQKGLISYIGENIETAKIELEAICTCLFERNKLPDDAVDDVITGLSLCSHEDFAAIFSQLSTARKNTLLTAVTLTGTILKQIKAVLGKADKHYTSYHLANQWNVLGSSAHYGVEKTVPSGLKCDHCGENHYVTDL